MLLFCMTSSLVDTLLLVKGDVTRSCLGYMLERDISLHLYFCLFLYGLVMPMFVVTVEWDCTE